MPFADAIWLTEPLPSAMNRSRSALGLVGVTVTLTWVSESAATRKLSNWSVPNPEIVPATRIVRPGAIVPIACADCG